MILTDNFVYVHEPKTGGTFVTGALLRLHNVEWTRWTHLRTMLLKQVAYRTKYGTLVIDNNKHGTCGEIPETHRAKPVLASVRNPYDLYVSQYEFGWWKRSEFKKYYAAVPDFDRKFPRFPELSFAEYVTLNNEAFRSFTDTRRAGEEDSFGWQTEQFFKYYFKNPLHAFARAQADEDYIPSGEYRADMFDVRFVRTDHLNRELHEFLSGMNYEASDIEFILSTGKILPQGKGRTSEQKWERYYTPELKSEIRRKERLIFKLFPSFDV